MENRRVLPRRQTIYYLRVSDRKNRRLIGRVTDITTDGIRLCCEKPLAIDRTLCLTMDMPGPGKRKNRVKFEARSKWCGRDVNPDLFAAGLAIEKISDQDTRAIERLLVTSTFRKTV
ncbi:MAG: hypothetical protein JSU65_10185 [Candidatus Zixiibacteriota bacterium]|nr:MAG: hypothetical protein JSU65_10185 [candidate division Zixibacteria bacterium]